MPEKKILHLLYSGQGGLGTYFMNFVNSDERNYFQHHAFFYGIEPLNTELEYFCQKNQIPYQYIPRTSKIDLKAVHAVLKFVKKHKVQFLLLHTFSLSLMTIMGLFKKWKIIAIDHTPNQVKSKIEHLFTLINHLFAFKMIYFYKGHFEQTQKKFPFLRFGNNSNIVPKTVDIKFFEPSEEKAKNSVFTIGTTARLISGKRHDLVIKALAKLRADDVIVNFKIAGTGPKENELKNLVKTLDLAAQVEFTGLLTREELLDFYQSLDTYIHASEGETICYSIMEAQACGLPILASDVEGINNAISEKTGGLLFENNSNEVAKGIRNLADSAHKIESYKKLARAAAVQNANNFNNVELLYSILN